MAGVTLQGYSYNYVNLKCELSNPFTTEYYNEIVVSTGTTVNGSSNTPDGIIHIHSAEGAEWEEVFPDDGSDSVIYTDINYIPVDSDTEYTFYCYAQAKNNCYYYIGVCYLKTPYAPLNIISIEALDKGECVLTATSTDDVNFIDSGGTGDLYLYSNTSEYYSLLIDKEESRGTYTYYFSVSGTYTCANSYDIYFWFDSYCENDGETLRDILSDTCTFTPYPNEVLLYNNLSIMKNNNNINMSIKSQSNYLWDKYLFELYKDGVCTDTITATAFGDYSFLGLEEGEYTVVATAFYKGTQCYRMNSDRKTFSKYKRTKTITITASRPAYFYWSDEELSAFRGKGAITTLTADRWNEFVSNINDILRYKGLTSATLDNDLYGVAQGTYMDDFIKEAGGAKSGKTFEAKKFNIARYSIGTMKSTGIGDKTSLASEVVGSEFITLQDKLNEVT